MKRTAIAFALVSATTLGFATTSHAMSLPAQSALKQAVPSDMTEVYWRRGGGWWGPGIGLGIAAGALTAAALARPYWGGGYWGGYPGYAYAPAYDYGDDYAPAYAYGPTYGYAPAYAYGPTHGYAPAYSYSYGTTYVRPRASYAYGAVGSRVRYGNAWGSGVRSTYISGPRYRAMGSRSAVRVVNRRR